MIQQLILEPGRLVLRPLTPEGAPPLAPLAGRREIARTAISILRDGRAKLEAGLR